MKQAFVHCAHHLLQSPPGRELPDSLQDITPHAIRAELTAMVIYDLPGATSAFNKDKYC